MVVYAIMVFLCIIMLNHRINKLEEEIKDLEMLMSINSRILNYLCYIAPEPKEGQLTYYEYMNKHYGVSKEE